MRPSKDDVMLSVADKLSVRATCAKRKVGCVITDRDGNIMSTGYNGVPRGAVHCTDSPCIGAKSPAGSDKCQAVHAEINALIRCPDICKAYNIYVTVMPCNSCAKAIANSGIRRIITWATGVKTPYSEFPEAVKAFIDNDGELVLQF